MKLTIKTLQNSNFTVTIESDKTVKDLKETIEKEQGKEYPYGSQKLIYNGKILTDDSKLAEYEFDEKKFVVLMTTRPPPSPKRAASPSSKTTPAPSTETKTPATGSSSQTTTSAKSQKKPDNERATTGAPTTTDTISTSSPPAQQSSLGSRATFDAAALAEMSALSMGEPQIASRLASLMAQPHFRQMQDLIQQSPHLLSSTIESLAASDPDMYSFISENPDIFVNALNHPPLAGLRTQDSSDQQRQSSRNGGQQPVVDQLIGNVTDRDKQAIERLKELGFSEILAIQAYMACDKDEQLAANLLFQMEQ